MMISRRAVLRGGLTLAVAGALAPLAEAQVDAGQWRVYDTREGKDRRWRDLSGPLAEVNALFVGEFHDDPQTHLAEAALLEAVHGRVKERLTLAMEMIERDGQAALNDYLSGKSKESALPRAVTGWPNYKTDYRPMVEYARARRIPVLGSNAPQQIVRRVGREGLAAVLPSLSKEERATVAEYINTPEDEYYKRFIRVMTGGDDSAHGKMDPNMLRRIYEAQCVRDDTMAETVARALAEGRTVLHVNGSFHSDAGLGTAARTLWRRPLGTRIAVVKIIPVKGDVRKANPTPDRGEADYLIYVPDQRPEPRPAK